MAGLAVTAVIASTISFYVVYGLLDWLKVIKLPPDDGGTTGWDIIITLGLSVIALILALVLAVGMARRVVRPLDAIGKAARQIAGGDLSARVDTNYKAEGETALLIADFNAMANRLERMADDVSIWNAQIAHELRTPLTILQGRLQGVRDGVFLFDVVLIDSLLKQVGALSRLVEDLRSVSLAESGRLELVLTTVNLVEEINDMAPTLRSVLEPAGFSLMLHLAPGEVCADATRIRQAILALVDNARRHADPCVLTITTSFAGAHASIAVTDKGPGLPADLEEDAFHQFVRADKVAGGSGLGLSIVRGIARIHGGDAVYSKGTDGYTFEFVIPKQGPGAPDTIDNALLAVSPRAADG